MADQGASRRKDLDSAPGGAAAREITARPRMANRDRRAQERLATRVAHARRRSANTPRLKRKDSSRLAKAKKLPPKEMFEAIAKADSEEDPPPTSPVTESREIIMNSPENAPDAAKEDLANAKSPPVQEYFSPDSTGEELLQE